MSLQNEVSDRTHFLGMGFNESDFERDTGDFQRLADAYRISQTFAESSLIILDEPTNHLDIVSQHWVEQYLKHYQGIHCDLSRSCFLR